MKNHISGTKIGSTLLQLRSWIHLRTLSFRNPEQAAATANALIADRLIAKLPIAGGSFLDIGAHIGSIFSSVYLSDNSIQITAVEADKNKADFLTTKFPYCKVLNFAVGEETGTATFNISKSSGYSSLLDVSGDVASRITVDIRMLDELFPEATFDVIKMDIEGAELGALRGGKALLRRSRPVIMFESAGLHENSLGYSAQLIWQWFDQEGFEIFTPNRLGHNAPGMSKDAFLDAHEYPMQTHNFFAVPSEKRTAIRDRAREILEIS